MNISEGDQVLLHIDRKVIRGIAKIGMKFTSSGSIVGHILPFAIIRDDSCPIDGYAIIDLKDLPAATLAVLGLKKIPANEP